MLEILLEMLCMPTMCGQIEICHCIHMYTIVYHVRHAILENPLVIIFVTFAIFTGFLSTQYDVNTIENYVNTIKQEIVFEKDKLRCM